MDIRPPNHLLAGEKGSASVLVILLMVVLVSLGYFTIASANANIQLSRSALEWNDTYYDLDGEGEAFVAEVDRLLHNAQLLTNEYFDTRQYLAFAHPDLPLSMHMVIYEGYESAYDKDYFIVQSMDTVFFFYAEIELQKLTDTYPDAIISSLKEGDYVLALICDTTLTHEESPEHHLNISISVGSYASYRYDLMNDSAATTKRYVVSNWSQWQNRPVDVP